VKNLLFVGGGGTGGGRRGKEGTCWEIRTVDRTGQVRILILYNFVERDMILH